MNIGGLIKVDRIVKAVSQISVNWTWNNESQGLVQWTFQNTSNEEQSCLLLRNNYYFGNAFWPVYVANSQFGVNWAISLTPLVDYGISNNNPPIGVVDFGNSNYLVAFIFTLSAGQTWSMLEGGFSNLNPPVFQSAPIVTLSYTGNFCTGYDNAQIIDWDTQTGTTYQGYSPNPSTISTIGVDCNSSYISLYDDPISEGTCNTNPSPTNPCIVDIEDGLQALLSGDSNGLLEIEDGIMCLITSLNIPLIKMFGRSLIKRIEKIL